MEAKRRRRDRVNQWFRLRGWFRLRSTCVRALVARHKTLDRNTRLLPSGAQGISPKRTHPRFS